MATVGLVSMGGVDAAGGRGAAMEKARMLARCVDLVRSEAMGAAFDADGDSRLHALAELIGELRSSQEMWLERAGLVLRDAA